QVLHAFPTRRSSDLNQMYLQCSQRNAGIVSGINQILAGLFSTVGSVPISGTASFIESTKQFLRLPFIIGSLLVVIVSFFPVFIKIGRAHVCTPVTFQ